DGGHRQAAQAGLFYQREGGPGDRMQLFVVLGLHIAILPEELFSYWANFMSSKPQFSDTSDAATKEALRCRTALYAGFQSLAQRPLCTATAVAGRQGKAVCPSAADAAACGRQQP